VVAENLFVPTALVFAPDGRLFVSERPGRIRVIIDGHLQDDPLLRIRVASGGDAGLLGLAVDPNFRETGYLYVMYTYIEAGQRHNRISRLAVSDGENSQEETLLEDIPGGVFHNGGCLTFGPDGMLYAATGDVQKPELAQDMGSLAGKILRIRPDGTIPADNPIPGSYVYALGFQNPKGLAWQPDTGFLFVTDEGALSGSRCDEINRVIPGGNYGWPAVCGAAGDERFVDPILSSDLLEIEEPAAAIFYNGELLAAWRGDLLITMLSGEHLQRITLGAEEGQAPSAQEVLLVGYGRLRGLTMAPDGALYVATSNRDGKGNPSKGDDRILRIVPAHTKESS